jgi:hypothetical protein
MTKYTSVMSKYLEGHNLEPCLLKMGRACLHQEEIIQSCTAKGDNNTQSERLIFMG